MNQCDLLSESLTAWIDGELRPTDERAVAQHVANCSACAAAANSLRRAIDRQKEALPAHLQETPVDVAALRMDFRRRFNALRREEERTPRAWSWLIRPFAMATAGLATVLLVVVWRAGEPESMLVSLGVEAPPAELATRPDLFQYLDIIENLEAFEHFEAVQAVRLEDERAGLNHIRHG